MVPKDPTMVPETGLVWPYVDLDRGKEKNRTELDPIWIERKEKQGFIEP